MRVCRSYGRVMFHHSYAHQHSAKITTIKHLDGPETIWKKLFAIGRWGVYYYSESRLK